MGQEGKEHPFVTGRRVVGKPMPPERSLPRKTAQGEDHKLHYGMQDTFLEDQDGHRLPPVPFRGGRPLQPVDRVEAEGQEFEYGASKETISAARRQRHAIRRNIQKRKDQK